MAEANVTCVLSIAPETLSAWRDKQIKATDAVKIERHVPTCAACQHELGYFEMVARALHRQRELEPSNRIWRGMQVQIAGHPHARRQFNTRAFMSGISGIIVVVLLGFVFARVLGSSGSRTSPIATAVTTTQPVATATPMPTTSGSPIITPPNVVTIAQAWGPNAAKQSLTTPSDATHVFQATNITTDGTKLLGDKLTFSSNSKDNPGPNDERAGFLDIATRQFTDIGITAPTVGLLDRPGCCMTDGNFLVAEDNSQPGATGSYLHNRFWAYDLQQRQPMRHIAAGEQFQEIVGGALDHGILVVNTGNGFQLEDLATTQATPLVPPGGNQTSVALVAFTWPYLIYANTILTATSDTTAVYVHNMTTNADTPLPQSIAAGINNSAAITGDTLFYTTSAGTFEVDHFTAPGAQRHLLTTYTGSLIGANARIVLFGSAGLNYVACDRVKHQLVQLVGSSNTSGTQAALSGNFLIVIQPFTISSPQQIAEYDTSQLPGG